MPFDYYPEFITSEEEAQILAKIYHCDAQWQQRFTERRMQTFGFQYIQGSTDVISVAAIPSEFDWILSKLTSLTKITFNQLTINEYKPGQGIDEHYDHKTRFGNQICGLTLGSGQDFYIKVYKKACFLIYFYKKSAPFIINFSKN
jgi:alkylated DNA repair dioxygenase AlkB